MTPVVPLFLTYFGLVLGLLLLVSHVLLGPFHSHSGNPLGEW